MGTCRNYPFTAVWEKNAHTPCAPHPMGDRCWLHWGCHGEVLDLFKEAATSFSGAPQGVQKRAPSAWGHYNEVLERVRAKWGCRSKATSPESWAPQGNRPFKRISGWDCGNAGRFVLVEVEATSSGQQFLCLGGDGRSSVKAPAWSHSSCGCGTPQQAAVSEGSDQTASPGFQQVCCWSAEGKKGGQGKVVPAPQFVSNDPEEWGTSREIFKDF